MFFWVVAFPRAIVGFKPLSAMVPQARGNESQSDPE